MRGRRSYEVLDERSIIVIDFSQFLKVLLDVSLSTKDRIQMSVLVGSFSKQGRLVRLDGSAGRDPSGIVRSDGDDLLLDDARKGGGEGVDLVASQEGSLELVQDEVEHVPERTVVVLLVEVVGDEAEEAGDELRVGGWLVVLGELVGGLWEGGGEVILELGGYEVESGGDEEGVFEAAVGEHERA